MNIRYRNELSQCERATLQQLVNRGRHSARKLTRARILLAADEGLCDSEIVAHTRSNNSTVTRVKRRFVEGNLDHALEEHTRPGARRKLTDKQEALLSATACSTPPKGRGRWTLELLSAEVVRLTDHDDLSYETVRRRLQENQLKPWRKDMWCIAKSDAAYVAAMEDVLDLYAEKPNHKRPVICFDENPVQLIGETRTPIPAAAGRLERYDYEYRRNGTANLFVFLDTQACQLAQYGGNRNRCFERSMPQPQDRSPRKTHRTNRCLGKTTQPKWRTHQMDVHNRARKGQNAQALSEARRPIKPSNQRVNFSVKWY